MITVRWTSFLTGLLALVALFFTEIGIGTFALAGIAGACFLIHVATFRTPTPRVCLDCRDGVHAGCTGCACTHPRVDEREGHR